ncbi:hypothetical protein AUC61_21215 [Pseudomonas sp. S25]|uniref:Dermonecrotic toxin N-terminal domain-containing protein n=1 Tax=Pseudomonas maioricensis TaxID=1766623 RepID=A0ABS9ZRB5_9PSED|nr:DUF6543 domain-containing protein [Pseudomonas sp. S25]MCI8212057.1 hypothetical protein [Pseudomonas sp. S25]
MNDSQTTAVPVTSDEWTGLVRDLVVFDSLPPSFPEDLNQSRITEHLQRILNYVGSACEQLDALNTYQSWRSRFHGAARAVNSLLEALDRADHISNEVLLAVTPQLVEQRQAGLLAQAQLQVCEGTLSPADLQALQYALGLADEPEDNVVHLEVGLGDPEEPVVFNGAFIVSTEQSLKNPALDEPALLFVPGLEGGLQKFASLQGLKEQLVFTLGAGDEVSLWQHVSDAQRTSAMAAPIKLTTRVITMQPVLYGVSRQLRVFEADSHAQQARTGEASMAQRETLARLHRELAHAMGVALDEARERAIDLIAEQQRTAELVPQLPAWLLNASLEVRQDYAQKLIEFHAAAARLESSLEARLPTFEVFTARCVSARVKQDLGLDIDTDQLVIDLPKSVHKHVDIDPQYGSPLHHKPWTASEARVQSSLSELARQNFDDKDEHTKARMGMVRVSYPPSPTLSGLQGINGDYLLRIVPQLDVAGQYRTLLRSVFRLRSPASSSDAELMLGAYEQQIVLDGFCARQRGRLSVAGYALLNQAARARSTSTLSAAGVYISRLVFKPGQAVTGARSTRTLQGLSVIEHPASGKVLVYLPNVPDGECFIETDSVQDARQRLISSLLRLPARVAWLASCVEEASEHKTAEGYIHEALRRGFEGFIAIVPALDLLLSEQQLHLREDLLYEHSRRVARSNHDLKGEANERRNGVYLLFFRGVISFVPGLGVLFSVQDGWSDGHASAKAFREGHLDEGLLLAGSTLISMLDVLLSVIPAGSTVTALAILARRATRLRQAAGLTRPLPSMARRSYVVKPFIGYETDISLLNAVPQVGRDAGTWLKDGELFIYRQGKAYQVYRRPGEQTLRLKKSAAHGYEAPVRQLGGQWVYHTDVGLRAGGRSFVAEILLVEARGSVSNRKGARELLDQFAFPADQQQRMELLLAEHYRKTKTLPDWAEQYRRPQEALAAPVPVKRKEPDSPQVEPDRRPPQPVAGPSRPDTSVDAWTGWEKTVDNLTLMDQVSFNPPVFRLDFTHDYDLIRIGQKFYEILPAGGQRRTNTAFIRNPSTQAPCRNFAELSEVLRRNPNAQPLMAKYQPATGQWAVEGPLFNRRIETYVAEARPGFTDITNIVLAQKLYELADTSTSTITATRMINVKATLNAWRAGHGAPLAHLNDPLLMLNKAQPVWESGARWRWNISYESSLHTFERLDFATDNPVTVEWLIRLVSDAGGGAGSAGLRGLMSDVLGRNGYTILHNELKAGGRDFIAFRRAGQDEVYLLYLRRAQNSTLTTVSAAEPFSTAQGDGLVGLLTANHAGQPIAQILEQAAQQGKVIKLMGGTNVVSQSSHGTQVFVIRLSDDFSISTR